ncbi:PREDICTED: HLA class II histocompatibility antigen gamma chain isoform X1 [Nanorana parkeri]|uniref:HLA class II histocompatibility antigen gamma chain isoform X1 n=1 Tax=Nanorana parkeri TaxID=125878 RepID=UPI0008547BF3|nr:PREDICTED: HLA class II histocompatibility antigen gamma chain isoform X1 [Nanorana parkeri]
MADETQNLVQNGIPEESVVETGERQSRTVTCTKKTVMPILSIFVALLIAGQAVSVYFISQQQSTISHLQETTTALKLKDMMKNLPGSPQSQNRPKLRMASFNIPLAFKDTDGSSPNLEEIAEGSNKIEDAVKYMLLRTNPLRTYPSLNGTVLDNLRKLKKNLSDQEWMVFDAWMQQWYLFYLVQNTDTPKTAPAPTGTRNLLTTQKKDQRPAGRSPSGNLVYASITYSTDTEPSIIGESPSGASVLSECMAKASVHALPGAYLPQCDENGGFKATQCWRSTGYCWCVYKNGTEIPDTRSRAKIDCESKNTHVLLI